MYIFRIFKYMGAVELYKPARTSDPSPRTLRPSRPEQLSGTMPFHQALQIDVCRLPQAT